MSKKPVTLSKGANKKVDYDDDEDEDEGWIEEETPAMAAQSAKDTNDKHSDKPDAKDERVLTPEEKEEHKILERTAAKLKADEEEHQKVRDQHDKDNEQRRKEAEAAAAKAAKEAEAQQAKQDAEMRKGAHG